MSRIENLEGKKFNHWLVLEELGGGKIKCQCDCEDHTVKILDKYSVKKGKSTNCGCVNKFKGLKGQRFGYWEVLDDIDAHYAQCKCICGKIKKVQKAHLKNGTSISCGCMRTNIENTVGKQYGYYTVIKELGGGKVLAKCVCGNIKELYKDQLKSGRVKSCGCMTSKLKSESLINDLTGQKINEWTILEELGDNLVKCRCTCGTEKIVQKPNIINGASKSCGHNTNMFVDLTNKRFGEWVVIKELGYGKVTCRCNCGTTRVVDKASLLNGKSKSCGCKQYEHFVNTAISRYGEITANKFSNPREEWQIQVINDREKFIEFVTSEFNYKPTINDLTSVLSINNASVGRVIKKIDVKDYVDINPMYSKYEVEILNILKQMYKGDIITNDRQLLNGKELDIYIPEKHLAIEFNGDYWHSTVYKDKNYHQEKTMACARKGVQLIHIFEHEWIDTDKQNKIKYLLSNILQQNNKIVYARNLLVKEISKNDAYEFLEKYHIQGYSNAIINIGLLHNNDIVGVLTLGKPRFNHNYEYEIHRMCFKPGIGIVGGLEKMFKYFLDVYTPQSIITYSDISKFTGNSYIRLGFKPIQPKPVTEPNYVWVDIINNKVLNRYQTQKQKLLNDGLGYLGDTEDAIMEELGYLKVCDSGNIKLEWRLQDV